LLKKRFYIALSFALCCLKARDTYAQVVLNIPEANITSQSDYMSVVNGPAGLSLGLFASVKFKANSSNFAATAVGSSASLPLNLAFLRMDIKTILSLISTGFEKVFSTDESEVYYAVVAISGGTIFNYRISTAGKSLLAGSYRTTLTFNPPGMATPAPLPFTIVIPSFITQNVNPAITTLNINTFTPFTNTTGITGTNSFNYYTTVLTNINIKSTAANFGFTTSYNSNVTPVNASSFLNAQLSSPAMTSGPVLNLTQTDQLMTGSAIGIAATNRRDLTATFNITAADLKSKFVQAGVYNLPISYKLTAANDIYTPAPTPSEFTMPTSVQLTVEKMSNISIPTPTVSIAFSAAADYQLGVTKQMPGHIKVSSTVPWSVTVKANSDFLTNGANQIPVSMIHIEGIPGQNGTTTILPITLSSTAQPIVSTANPSIDQLLNLQYRVPAAQSLVGKVNGKYATTITYTLVAP